MGRGSVRVVSVLALIASLLAVQATMAGPAGASDSTRNSIDGGDGFTCALTDTGTVTCWGANTYGQLADGTTERRVVPTPTVGLTDVVEIGAGWGHACALTSVGAVQCWGLNGSGQVGDGTTTNRATPVDVVGLTSGVAAVSAGDGHSCAITTTGGLKCWGSNEGGGLGDGTTTHRSTPVDVVGLTSGVAVVATAGTFQVGSRTCAVTTAGGLKCWGGNNFGQVGDGTTTDRTTPVDVVGLTSGVADVTTGTSHTCARTTAGGAKCWGNFAVGAGVTGAQLTPLDVTGLTSGVDELRAGGFHTCAFTDTGGLKCWGGNNGGQLGVGYLGTNRGRVPIDVSGSFRRPECPTLLPEPNTSFVSTDGYAAGSVVTFVADPGFAVDGPPDRTCQANLTFDGPPPPAVATSTITLDPATGIVGGQTVDVTLSGFAPDTDVGWCYAVIEDPLDQANCSAIFLGTTDGSGGLATTLRLDRFIWLPGLARWVDCASESCAIGAAAVSDIFGTLAIEPVDLIVPPPPATRGEITLDPPRSGGGRNVTVAGTGFRPGAEIEVFQCRTGPTTPADCEPAITRVDADPTGAFATDILVRGSIEPVARPLTLCFTPDGACEIAAAEASDFPGTVATAPLLDDLPTPTVLPGGGTVVEGTDGTTVLEVAVTLSNEFDEAVEVPWATVFDPAWDPTVRADPGEDYTPSSGTVTFAPFETEQTVQIPIVADLFHETTEWLVVAFTKPDNAEMNGFFGLGFGAIIDDDGPG